jgi:putative FmdB family regulatory protein
MPMYKYVCAACQAEFELRRRRSDCSKKAPCPDCGGAGKRRITEFSGKKKG